MANPKVIIRVDGNSKIGLGHIYRGIALAEMIKVNFNVKFLLQKKSISSPITEAGYNIEYIPQNIALQDEPDFFEKTISNNTIIVLDGYEFNESYQNKIKGKEYKLVFIDDLAIGTQKADLVINHSPGIRANEYQKEKYTTLALGMNFALLRKSFINYDRGKRKLKNDFSNVLVSFGGADPKNFTHKTVIELLKSTKIKQINIVLGVANKDSNIHHLNDNKIQIHQNLTETDIFELMSNADLGIVPASTTAMELASLGVPMLLGYYVENQKNIYKGFIENNAVYPLGDLNIKDFSEINDDIFSFSAINKGLKNMFNSSPQKNIIRKFNSLLLSIRVVEEKDIDFLFDLSNDSIVRENSYKSNKIEYANHKKWFNAQLETNRNFLFILVYKNNPVGQVRFSFEKEHSVIGISLLRNSRGKGLASAGLVLGINKYFEKFDIPIYAFIKKSNFASIHSFQNAGFEYLKDVLVENEQSVLYTIGK
jgi:UDP-2,4-diacetamido-2,4,6-trideoxy-beta-L-altropyranose hydrolase